MSGGVVWALVCVEVYVGVGVSSFACFGVEVGNIEGEELVHEIDGCEDVVGGSCVEGIGRCGEVWGGVCAIIGADGARGVGVIDADLIAPVVVAAHGAGGRVDGTLVAFIGAANTWVCAVAHGVAPWWCISVRRGKECYVIIISSNSG